MEARIGRFACDLHEFRSDGLGEKSEGSLVAPVP